MWKREKKSSHQALIAGPPKISKILFLVPERVVNISATTHDFSFFEFYFSCFFSRYDDKSGRELKEEIQRIKDEIEGNREQNKQLELEIKHKRRAHQKNLYREYLRGNKFFKYTSKTKNRGPMKRPYVRVGTFIFMA